MVYSLAAAHREVPAPGRPVCAFESACVQFRRACRLLSMSRAGKAREGRWRPRRRDRDRRSGETWEALPVVEAPSSSSEDGPKRRRGRDGNAPAIGWEEPGGGIAGSGHGRKDSPYRHCGPGGEGGAGSGPPADLPRPAGKVKPVAGRTGAWKSAERASTSALARGRAGISPPVHPAPHNVGCFARTRKRVRSPPWAGHANQPPLSA